MPFPTLAALALDAVPMKDLAPLVDELRQGLPVTSGGEVLYRLCAGDLNSWLIWRAMHEYDDPCLYGAARPTDRTVDWFVARGVTFRDYSIQCRLEDIVWPPALTRAIPYERCTRSRYKEYICTRRAGPWVSECPP